MRNSPLRAFVNDDKKKKDKKTPRQKWIDKGIEKGTLPKPDTKKKLEQWKGAYFEEIFV